MRIPTSLADIIKAQAEFIDRLAEKLNLDALAGPTSQVTLL